MLLQTHHYKIPQHSIQYVTLAQRTFQLTKCCDGWHVTDAAGCWAKLDFCALFSESLEASCLLSRNLLGYICNLRPLCRQATHELKSGP